MDDGSFAELSLPQSVGGMPTDGACGKRLRDFVDGVGEEREEERRVRWSGWCLAGKG